MRSDAIDDLLSSYLKMPAKVSWTGALADSVRGNFEGIRLELAGIAILALPFERLVMHADSFQFTPGMPARIEASQARIEITIDQRQLDVWLRRSRAPFDLQLTSEAIEFQLQFGRIPIARTKTELRIRRGWFVLQPKNAEFLGIRARLVSLFRTYLPLPRLAPQTRLSAIRHGDGVLRFELSLDDFSDVITPGLVDRLQRRFLPFASFSPLAALSRMGARGIRRARGDDA
jgi:hypothetical protein